MHCGARVVDWSTQDLREITDMRALLEGYGANLATKIVTPDTLNQLQTLATQMEKIAYDEEKIDSESMTHLNSQFHIKIMQASGNRKLVEIIDNLVHPLLAQRRFLEFSRDRLLRSMSHHQEIIDALSARDSQWAQAIMRTHILASTKIT